MWLKWLPWRFVLSRLARSRGFIDPVALLARLHRFAQPSEVAEPIELLRAGVLFHARGLINTRTLQHNLDWVWPYWVERQFDPHDISFVPRAFSITHVNLTHRNWTAVGQPDCDAFPIVDPRGLLTPLFDGWSLDAWVVPDQGAALLPSRADKAVQHLKLTEGLSVETETRRDACSLRSIIDVAREGKHAVCRLHLCGSGPPGWLAVAVRPVNPEGVSFIHTIRRDETRAALRLDNNATIYFDRTPDRVCMSDYRRGDVLHYLGPDSDAAAVTCDVGLATAAALYRLGPGGTAEVIASVPLARPKHPETVVIDMSPSWQQALRGVCRLEVPDERIRFLFDAAVHNLVLHSPGEVYPGPYTYKRFWFRDAAFILNGLLAVGLTGRVRRCLDLFPDRQTALGYFLSQEGEWDSNGEALWIMDRYRRLSGEALPEELMKSVLRGARWIGRKRVSNKLNAPYAGLMPAGFSAEHLGLNDYYYWDDFWSAAGLRAAAALAREDSDPKLAASFEAEADDLLACIDRSIKQASAGKQLRGVPASPYRRMDSGAIGSLAGGYPLQLWDARDPRLLETVEFLLENCLVRGGFFQDMIHSGINPYLTLHMAQVLLQAGDPRHVDLVKAVAGLASPTGQWPEAIHPNTLGGCMGDGQHIWAAAEWVLMLRNAFVREEGSGLVIGAGLFPEWIQPGNVLRLGPTLTPFGPVAVEILPAEDEVQVRWQATWRGKPPALEVVLPDHPVLQVPGEQGAVAVPKPHTRPRLPEHAQ
jgi:hypothetical protein